MADPIILSVDHVDDEVLPAVRVGSALTLLGVAELWANATTDPTSHRRRDLIRDKTNVVLSFFEFVAKPPAAVTPADVHAWQLQLERDGLAPATVYAAI